MSRTERKLDHIEHALKSSTNVKSAFDDIQFVHQSFPDGSLNEISLKTEFEDLKLDAPVFINAMTGGGGKATEGINASLAEIAGNLGIPIAAGSQMSALKDPQQRRTYEVIRKKNPKGIVFANVGSEASAAQAEHCVEMLEADALQIHMNTVQELVMPEGDRNFSGAIDRVQEIKSKLSIPVIVKEVGFGISRETAEKLLEKNISAVDVGGRGGTNFSIIENARRDKELSFFNSWGISTPASIAEVKTAGIPFTAASGGIKTSEDMAKSIALGADICGMAGQVLKWLQTLGQDQTHDNLQRLLHEIKIIMTALGASNLQQLQRVPLVIKGETREWLNERGISTTGFARR